MKSDVEQWQKTHVAGVIVTYRPNDADLMELVRSVRTQVETLIVIDNGDGSLLPATLKEWDVEVFTLGENFGIAHAQNVGIDYVRKLGFEFVLLLDQDSIPAGDMVRQLQDTYSTLTRSGLRVAALGPSYTDPRQGEVAPFVYRDGVRLKRRTYEDGQLVTQADFLIASGCLIPLHVLDVVGTMEDSLFIDYVDIEWGLRARERGYQSFGVFQARMQHALGDEWIEFLGRRVPVHSPLRHYYHFRNALWLAKRSWIGWAWRVILVWRLVLQFAFFGLLAKNRRKHVKMMLSGLWHGMTGRMGRLD